MNMNGSSTNAIKSETNRKMFVRFRMAVLVPTETKMKYPRARA